MNLPNLPQDKANHAIYGAVIFCFCFLVLCFFKMPNQVLIAGLAVFACSVLKEASDAFVNWRATGSFKHGPHGVEFLDVVATCFGGLLAAIPVLGLC